MENNKVTEISTKNKSKKNFRLLDYIELIKWFIGSILLVVITIIIDKGFKERSAGIQEMQAFDKYVEIILKADNIEERWKLSEFFSTVTPTERLRNKWEIYKKIISTDYITFKTLKEKEFALKEEIKNGKSTEAIDKLYKIKKQLEPYEKKLVASANTNILKGTEPDVEKLITLNTEKDKPIPKVTQVYNSKEMEANLIKFKDDIKKEASKDFRYKIDEIFNKSRDINNDVVQKLSLELGEPYQTIQTSTGTNYKDQTYSNQYGILSKFDNTRAIWPVFQVKVLDTLVTFKMSENEKFEILKSPIESIEWEKVRQFIRNYFIKRLEQLK